MKKEPYILTYRGKLIETMTVEELKDALRDAALEVESLRDMLKTDSVVREMLRGVK